MNISKELYEKAKTAKTAEELSEIAKAEKIEMTEAEIAEVFVALHENAELSDDELDLATGGSMGENTGSNDSNPIKVYRRDSRGNPTHWLDTDTGKIYYYACPRCGRVTHEGWFNYAYCDPCDTYWNKWSERRVYIN